MEIHTITDTYFVSPQIDTSDMSSILSAGIKTIICNRPDNEVPSNIQAKAIEAAAHKAGLNFHILPLTHQTMTPENIALQMEYARSPGSVLAYCASGTRCTVAWAIGSAMEGKNIDAILEAAAKGGYQLEGLRPVLQDAAKPAGK